MELGVGLARVSKKGSPSVPGSSVVNLICGSMELRCSWSLLTWSFLVAHVHSFSCLGSLRSLLNTVGILTLPMFLLIDGSMTWMWSASFAWRCRVLLSLSIIVKSLSSAFGCFVRCGGFWWHWWFDFYGLKLFLSGPVGFALLKELWWVVVVL